MTDLPEGEKLGTTTVAIKTTEGIVMATDLQATVGHVMVSNKAKVKIQKITKYIGTTETGRVGDAQAVLRFLKAKANSYKIENGKEITTKRIANLMATLLNENKYYPYIAAFTVGGYVGKPELYGVDEVGGFTEVKDYTSTGSGSLTAYGVLEDLHRPGLTMDEAIVVAVKAVRAARERDTSSGGVGISVATITKKGLVFKDDQVARDIVAQYPNRTFN